MNVRKPIIENPVYCDILIMLSHKRQSVTGLLELFGFGTKDFTLKKKDGEIEIEAKKNAKFKPNKSQPALREQLLELKKQGYVELIDKDEHGKNFPNNQKFFAVKWDKIAEQFINFVVRYYKEIGHKYPNNKQFKEFENARIKEIETKKADYKNNFFLKKTFQYIFDDYYRQGHDWNPLISSIFNDMISYDVLEKTYKRVIKSLGYEELDFKDNAIFLEKLKQDIGKKRFSDFQDYNIFVGLCPSITKQDHYEMVVHWTGSSIARELLGETEYEKRRRDMDNSKEIIEKAEHEALMMYKPYFPTTEKEKSISKKEVIEIVNKIEKIRKGKKYDADKLYKDTDKIRKLALEVHKKFYFVPQIFRVMEIEELERHTRAFYLKRNLLKLEIGLIQHYGLSNKFNYHEIWEHHSKMEAYHKE